MQLSLFLENSTKWLIWTGSGLAVITILAFFVGWGFKYRLVGTTIFTLLLAGSSWAFSTSYTKPFIVSGAKYAPIVYDNGYDLVVAQASEDFPTGSIQPTLEQITGNLKESGRSGAVVHVRIRKVENLGNGSSTPVILGEVTKDFSQNTPSIPTTKQNEE